MHFNQNLDFSVVNIPFMGKGIKFTIKLTHSDRFRVEYVRVCWCEQESCR